MDTVQCASSAQARSLCCYHFSVFRIHPHAHPCATSTFSPLEGGLPCANLHTQPLVGGGVYSVPTHTFTPLVGVGGSPLCHSVKMRFGRAAERPRVPKRSLWDGPVSDPKARTPNSQCSSKLADASGHMAYLPLAWNFEASL